MQDSDPGIRLRVMQAVADAKGAAVPALIEALKNESAAYWACLILRDIGPDAVGLSGADREAERSRAGGSPRGGFGPGAIGSPDAAAKIVPLLKDETARTAATFALGALGKVPADAEPTIQANVKSSDALLSTTSLWALARVHPNDANLKRAALTQIVARLKDKDPLVRTAAARAWLRCPRVRKSPVQFSKRRWPTPMKQPSTTCSTHGWSGSSSGAETNCCTKYPGMRAQTAYILGQIGPPAAAATPALAKLTSDPDPNVAMEAAHALAKIGPAAKAAVPVLIEVLKQPESKSAHAAVFALGMIGPGTAASEPALLEVIKSKDDSLSLLHAWAIIKIRGVSSDTAAKVISELLVALDSQLPQSRQAAAESLGELGPLAKGTVDKLQRTTKDENEGVRAAVTKAMKAIRG